MSETSYGVLLDWQVMMVSVLAPRNLRSLLGEALRIYGRNFFRILAIVAIYDGPSYVLAHIVKQNPYYLQYLCRLPVFIVAYPWMEGALIYAISEQYVRQTMNVGHACRFALGRLRVLIPTAVLAFSIIFLIILGILIISHISRSPFLRLGVLVALYFWVRWAFIFQAALLEGLGPRGALSRSSALVKENWWRVLGIMVALYIIPSAIIFVMKGRPLLAAIGVILSIPLCIITQTLLYYDLRLKKEGYSFEELAHELRFRVQSES